MSLVEFYGGDHKGSVFGYSAEYGSAFHYGQDIKRHPVGTPIPALWGGVVARVGWQTGHGFYVSMRRPDGYHESHSHMHEHSPLEVGQTVVRAQTVGPLGSTGQSTGPHDHVQLSRSSMPWIHGTEVDPWPQIAAVLASTAGGGTRPILATSRRKRMFTVYKMKGRDDWSRVGETFGVEITTDIGIARLWGWQATGDPATPTLELDRADYIRAQEQGRADHARWRATQIELIREAGVGGGGSTDLRPVLEAVESIKASIPTTFKAS